jgi:hypothetical protein
VSREVGLDCGLGLAGFECCSQEPNFDFASIFFLEHYHDCMNYELQNNFDLILSLGIAKTVYYNSKLFGHSQDLNGQREQKQLFPLQVYRQIMAILLP